MTFTAGLGLLPPPPCTGARDTRDSKHHREQRRRPFLPQLQSPYPIFPRILLLFGPEREKRWEGRQHQMLTANTLTAALNSCTNSSIRVEAASDGLG